MGKNIPDRVTVNVKLMFLLSLKPFPVQLPYWYIGADLHSK
jgi:hypothetical protein